MSAPSRALLAAVLTVSLWAQSAAALAQPQTPAPALPAGSVVQVVIGLVAVLAVVAGSAWLLKRFSALPGMGSGLIRVLGGAAVGQRERVVLVEVAGTWLVLGVAPGQVRALHAMPRAESIPAPAVPIELGGFAGWLRKTMEKNKT